MNTATERIVEMLKALDWNFEVDADSELVNTGFNGENGQWRVIAGGINDFTVLIASQFPIDCPQPQRRACAEVLTRINFGLSIGAFEMEYDTGRIHFKTNRGHGNELPTHEELTFLFCLNLRYMDHYLPTIMQVIYAGADPAKAVAALDACPVFNQMAEKAKAQSSRPKLSAQSRFQMN